MHRRFVLVMATLYSQLVFANTIPPRDMKSARVLWATDKQTIQQREIAFDSLGKPASQKMVHIDKATNPEQTESVWEGTYFSEHLRDIAIGDSQITIIGSDNYLVEFPGQILLNHKVILAIYRDSKKIPWVKGGAHTVMPLDDETLSVKYRTDPSYWVWTVAAIVVGELPLHIKLKRGHKSEGVELSKLPFQLVKSSPVYPPAKRTAGTRKSNIEASVVSLDKIVRPGETFKVSTFTGQVGSNLKNSQDYILVTAWDGKPIPVSYGGPVHLCHKKISMDSCSYFVETIEVQP